MSAAKSDTISPDVKGPRFAGLRTFCISLLGVLIVVAAADIAHVLLYGKPAIPESVSAAEYQKAFEEFSRLFHREPTPDDVLMLLAETAIRKDRLECAVDCFQMIPSDHRRYGLSARFQEAQALLRMNEADRAEESFRTFLQLSDQRASRNAEHILLARKWLVYLLAVELRFEERRDVLRQMIRDRQFDAFDAKQLFFPSLLIWQSSLGSGRLQEFLRKDPDNRRLLTSQARYLVGEGKLEAADQLLQKLREQHPKDSVVIAASLECCFEKNDWEEFAKLHSRTAEFSENEPWLLTLMRGEFALHNHEWASAERWFRHVLTFDPANPICHMGLAKVCQELGRNEERQELQQRSLTLARIRVNLAAVDNNSADAARALAADARTLGMVDAAEAFESLSERMERR